MKIALASRTYTALVAEDDGRVCRDIPESACAVQPRNFFTHVLSLAATKTGDGLADPKLTLSWLLTTLGAPPWMIGLLVPIREAGALLPQLMTAGAIRRLPRRKWVWAIGSAVQGAAVLGMAAAAWGLGGPSAGGVVLGLLTVFALARSVCSVSYKDVLGKTVAKSTRGTATGLAATLSAGAVLAFGGLLASGVVPTTPGAIAAALSVAAGLWLLAAAVFATLPEEPGATGGGGNALAVAAGHLTLLRDDPQLVRFIVTRGLLTSTALAPPYLLAMGGSAHRPGIGELGPLVMASSAAALCSTYLWGRLADRSSRWVLIGAGLIGGAVLAAAAAVGWADTERSLTRWLLPVLLFVLMLAYQGVRLGRSTHIVDMATPETRAAYTALSNTVIGLALLAAGAFGALAQFAGYPAVLLAFAGMSLAAAAFAAGLAEVQRPGA